MLVSDVAEMVKSKEMHTHKVRTSNFFAPMCLFSPIGENKHIGSNIQCVDSTLREGEVPSQRGADQELEESLEISKTAMIEDVCLIAEVVPA